MRHRCHRHLVALAIASLVATSPLLAAGPVADVSLGTLQVEWQPNGDYAGMKLRVSGPLGVVEQDFAEGAKPLFDLRSLESAADGLYTWEIVATPRLDDGVRRAIAEARAAGDGAAEGRLRASGALPDSGSMVQSGSFRVAGGAILQPGGEAEAPAAGPRRVTSSAGSGDIRRTTAADQVIPDDLIVQGSICAGFDCVNNESFGFDTIRLKENNTRIKFEDTSAGSFPSNDWQLTANDSASGGANKFSIEDITGAKVPFTLTAGATTNSIFVDSTGRVGFRTATPVLDLHVSTGNTPGIRLEQTSASGFTAQTWDIAGNEANFFVRDVTGGSRLSFRIRPGAPTSSIDISNDGDVGVGTASPDEKLHVFENVNENTMIVSENENTGTDAAGVVRALSNAATINFQAHGNGRTISRFGQTLAGWGELLHASGNGMIIGTLGANRLILGTNNTNVLEITAAGNVLHKGVQVHPDFVFEPSYELDSIEEHAAYMWENKHLPKVGPGEYTADGQAVYDLFQSRNGILEELETAHIYIDQLNDRLKQRETLIDELLARLERVEASLEAAE